jgi:Fe-S cluster biogenesis protein NfuA
MDFITSGEDIIISSETTSKNDADTVSLIINLLNARIRPTIQKDNGDIQFRDFDDGVVYVEMLGRCVGCPYASRTLKDGVEKIAETLAAINY